MRNKIIGALAAAVAVFGLSVGSAFAWTYGLSGQGACQSDGSFKITWTVDNSAENESLNILASSNTSVVPVGTQISAYHKQTFSQMVSGTQAGSFSLSLTGNFHSDQTHLVRTATVYLQHPCTQPTGSITVIKHLSPTTDTGVFNLKVNDTVVASNVGNNGQGTASHLSPGSYTVSETAGLNTMLSNYGSLVSCTDGSSGTTSVSVRLAAYGNVTCTFTNTRGGQGGGTVDCDNDTDNSPASECATPQKDCDNDTDNSPASECQTTTPTGGQGSGPTTTTTTAATTGVTTTPTSGVNAGGGAQILNLGSLVGLLASTGGLGFGLRRLKRSV